MLKLSNVLSLMDKNDPIRIRDSACDTVYDGIIKNIPSGILENAYIKSMEYINDTEQKRYFVVVKYISDTPERHKVKRIETLSKYRLAVYFSTGDVKLYDVSPLIESHERFEPLRDKILFAQVKVDSGGYGISWSDEIDLSCEELWDNSEDVDIQSYLLGEYD